MANTKKPTLKSLQMKVAALSKELLQKDEQLKLRDETIASQREELFELKTNGDYLQDMNKGLQTKNNTLKDEATHYKCERAEAIAALVEIMNTYPKKATDLFRVKAVARKALGNFNHFSED